MSVIRWRSVAVAVGVAAVAMGMSPHSLRAHPLHPEEHKADLSEVAAEMAEAAYNVLASLEPDQLRRAVYNFHDEERRNWHFRPVPRRGVYVNEMNAAQRYLVHALAATGLSARGHQKALTIMSLGQVLRDLDPEHGNKYFDSEYYSVTIFTDLYNPGDPTWREKFPNSPASSAFSGSWAWRIEGFHLSLNFTIVDGKAIASTPSFFGSFPADVKEGPHKGLAVLRREQELGRDLAKSLTQEQRKVALFPLHKGYVGHLRTGNARKVDPRAPRGLGGSQMTPQQAGVLKSLVEEYAHRHRPELAERDLARISQAGWETLHFSWAGGMEPRELHYYMVQGPTFLIEFDNSQDGDHIHSVWRDFEADFGQDLLLEHYKKHHGN